MESNQIKGKTNAADKFLGRKRLGEYTHLIPDSY